MKYLVKFKLFEEINYRDISEIVTGFDDYFTVSFEFEIETESQDDIKLNFEDLDDEIAEDIIAIIFKDLEVRGRTNKKFVRDLVYSLLDYVDNDVIDIETYNSMFSDGVASNSEQINILRHAKAVISSFIGIEDLTHLKKMVKLHLSDFYRKWYRRIDFIGDATLDRGIEIKPKTYLKSISESIEMLNDFFTNMKSQDYWVFSERTGLHINVGTNKKSEWNSIKGLLILNDISKSGTPLVFKDMTWRMNNNFCGSLISQINNMSDIEKLDLKSKIDLNNVNSAEDILNQFLVERIKLWGVKNFGFNITKLDQNYVEFRYVGGIINSEVVIEKLKYFCFLVYCMTNKEYKRKEYLGKLYKFVDNL
jgi:hypothetical protein